MTYGVVRANTFDFARVIDRAFATARDNFRTFFIIALCFAGAPAALQYLGILLTTPMLAGRDAGADVQTIGIVRGLIQIVGGLASAISALVLQGALVWGTATYLNGRRATIGEMIGVGLRKFLPLLALGLLLALPLFFGFLLFIVPGVFLALMWAVAGPAIIVENTRILEAPGRSGRLTETHRWSILGLSLLLWIVTSVFTGISSLIIGAASAGLAFAGAASVIGVVVSLVASVISGAVTAVVSMLGATGVGVLYVELRRAREGGAPQQVADVFD